MNDTLFIEIQKLCRLAHQRGVQELSISQPSFSVSLKAISSLQQAPLMPAEGLTPVLPHSAEPIVPSGYTIVSPLVGIFYRAASPDAPPFVEIGDAVEIGQTIGVVEAMKVFNEITADWPGTVIAIPASNGELVQVDQPLVILNPAD